jgi:hypothetical protein
MPGAACLASTRLLLPPLPSTPLHPPLAAARRRGSSSVRLAAARRKASPPSPAAAVDCVGTGSDVECFVDIGADPVLPRSPAAEEQGGKGEEDRSPASLVVTGGELWEWASLVSPFFFWGTAMVAMKGVIPRTGPFFVAALRLIPAGVLLVAFAAARGRKQPSGWAAWLAVAAFGFIDAACFQVLASPRAQCFAQRLRCLCVMMCLNRQHRFLFRRASSQRAWRRRRPGLGA